MKGLEIRDLKAEVGKAKILQGLNLTIPRGEVHALMGPNGSGKSTLAHILSGHPGYTTTQGTVTLDGEDLLGLSPEERTRRGLFLAFQYPSEIPGLTLGEFLEEAARSVGGSVFDSAEHDRRVAEAMEILETDRSFLSRDLNAGFSGGEKKRSEALQLLVLRPAVAVLDETDSGLDVDALGRVSRAVNRLRGDDFSALVITHYTRILNHIRPDRVHVLLEGRVVRSGGEELAHELEREGYEPIRALVREKGGVQ